MKCLLFKTFQSFAFNFHFKIHQSSSKLLLLFNIMMFLSKKELIKLFSNKATNPGFFFQDFFFPCNFIASGCPAAVKKASQKFRVI